MIKTQDSHRIVPHLQIGSRPIPPQSISAVNLIHSTTSLRNQNFINSCFFLFHRSPLPTSTPTLRPLLKLELALIIRHVSNFWVFSIYVIYAINNVIWDTREQQNLERRVQQRIYDAFAIVATQPVCYILRQRNPREIRVYGEYLQSAVILAVRRRTRSPRTKEPT